MVFFLPLPPLGGGVFRTPVRGFRTVAARSTTYVYAPAGRYVCPRHR
ncbi:hypothetical protein ACIQGZ_15420 [Streptomyces sp. NPDC092296]